MRISGWSSDVCSSDMRCVDLSDWSEQGGKLLPTGYWLRGPAQFAFDEMFASAPVARDGDGNCCPRGGNALFDLDNQDDRLVLTRLRFQPMQPLGRDIEVTAGPLNRKSAVWGKGVEVRVDPGGRSIYK